MVCAEYCLNRISEDERNMVSDLKSVLVVSCYSLIGMAARPVQYEEPVSLTRSISLLDLLPFDIVILFGCLTGPVSLFVVRLVSNGG
jgi:hypothetical protein